MKIEYNSNLKGEKNRFRKIYSSSSKKDRGTSTIYKLKKRWSKLIKIMKNVGGILFSPIINKSAG